MALIKDETKTVFDLTKIGRGDCIRVKRAGDTTARNGFVTETAEDKITVLYCNIQNNATSYLDITAADVSLKVWEIWWTRDFDSISHEPEDEQPEAVEDLDGEVDDEF